MRQQSPWLALIVSFLVITSYSIHYTKLYDGAYSESGGDANIGTGANSLQATFTNSEWTGTILYGDDEMTGSADLTFDADSTWTVTSDTTRNNFV